jgi:hypothetical protein
VPLQVAVSVTLVLTWGVGLLAASVQDSSAAAFHVTAICVVTLVYVPFDALTEYVTAPGDTAFTVQLLPAPGQFVHVYRVGEPVQFAVSVSDSPTAGFRFDAESVQATGAPGAGVGSPPPVCHTTLTTAGRPVAV